MIYSHVAAAIAGAAIAFAGAWSVQAWRYDTQIAKTAAAHATALADANSKSLTETDAMQKVKDDAIKKAESRARANAVAAAGARTERDGLRAQLASAAVQVPSASCGAVREYSNGLSEVLGSCVERYQAVAEEADGLWSGAKTLRDAWPRP